MEIEKTHTPLTEVPKSDDVSFWGEVIRFALIAVVIVLPIRLYIAQPFIVSGASMIPSFENGDYLIVDEISYRFEKPARGDVIIFRFPLEPSKFFIKRIIGLPNETISLKDGVVTAMTVDGESVVFTESYINQETGDIIESITLEEKEYFVMGDNRRQSADSRIWGALHEDLIIGKAFARLFPISKLDMYPGDITIDISIE